MDLLDVWRYIAAPLAAAVVGGLIVHVFARRRDAENDRRRHRVDYLVSAYRALARSAHRDLLGERAELFEDALADVIMFGTANQIALATQAMKDLTTRRDAPMDRLLLSLRAELRTQLDLPADDLVGVPIIRLSPPSDQSTPRLRLAQTFEAFFDRGIAVAREALGRQVDPPAVPLLSPEARRLHELAATAPGAAVAEAYGWLSGALVDVIDEPNGPVDALQLAELGVERGLVTPETARSVEGLQVLLALSHNDGAGTGLDPGRASDYVNLARATIYALQSNPQDPQDRT